MILWGMYLFLSDVHSSVVVLIHLQIGPNTDSKSTFVGTSVEGAKAVSANPDVKIWCIIHSINSISLAVSSL